MAEITQENWKHKAGSMLLTQCTAYAMLIAATVVPERGPMPTIPLIIAAMVLGEFILFWPFRGSVFDRAITMVFGAASLIFVFVPFPVNDIPPQMVDRHGEPLPWYSWALAVGFLLVVLVVFSFGRQMARKERSHLIRALSHAVTSGVAAIAVAGWCFLPTLGSLISRDATAGGIAVIILIVLAISLAIASVLWVRDADPDPTMRTPWIGTGLLPVMMMGVTIAAATLLLTHYLG